MSASDRETKIFAYIREHKIAGIDELAATFFASPASVRRDLDRLQSQGLIRRTHGGAVFLEKTAETGVFVRLAENRDAKERVALAAIKHIPDFETVFVDDSSTAFMLADKMDFSHKLVVTNGLQLATQLAKRRDVEVILPGGTLLYNTGMLSGSFTIENLRRFGFDLAITSCTALDELTTYERSQDSAILKRTAVKNSLKSMLLFDAEKLARHAPHAAIETNRFAFIVTDAPKSAVPFTDRVGCRLICADA